MVRPTPRPDVYPLYWEFAAKRQALFEARVAGNPSPWTDDPILQTYKFCNVYRVLDRVTQYLLREIIYVSHQPSLEDCFFQIIAFRLFSNINTWDSLREIVGHSPTISDLVSNSFERALIETKRKKGTLYTRAFILCAANSYGRGLKHLNHVALLKDMFITHDIVSELLTAPSFKTVYTILHKYPHIGDFMAYQLAIDLNYSPFLHFSKNDFVQPGPGALRGIQKIFSDLGTFSPQEIIHWMVDHQEEEFQRLGLSFHGLDIRPIQAIDAQNLFCEVDKYCRVAVPTLRSNRVKIKIRFSPHTDPITYIFPPKWHISFKQAR